MKRTEAPNQEEFDALLAWLDPDRDRAGAILCDEIRRKLIKILERRQCDAADELADETINRVSHRVNHFAATYEGNPAHYFYGFLKKVYLEWLDEEKKRREWLDEEKRKNDRSDSTPLLMIDRGIEIEEIHDYLEKCLQELESPDRELILKYFEKDKREKIQRRKELAEGLGITVNALRTRVHRINATLEKCIVHCLEEVGPDRGDVFEGLPIRV